MGVLGNETYTQIDISGEINECPVIPVFERIVIKEFEVDKVGRLFVPEGARGGELATNEGLIVAVGEEVSDFLPGDHIYYGRYSGFTCSLDGKKYRIMNREDIIGKVKDMNGNGK